MSWSIPHLSQEVGDIVHDDAGPEARLKDVAHEDEGGGSEGAKSTDHALDSSPTVLIFVSDPPAKHTCWEATSDDNNGVGNSKGAHIVREDVFEEGWSKEAESVSAKESEEGRDCEVDEALVGEQDLTFWPEL